MRRHISVISDFSLPAFSVNVFLNICSGEIKLRRTDFIFSASAFDKIFVSTFSKEIRLQIFTYRLSQLSVRCLTLTFSCEVLDFLTCLKFFYEMLVFLWNDLIYDSLSKIIPKRFIKFLRPSFLRDLLLDKLFTALFKSSLFSPFSHRFI